MYKPTCPRGYKNCTDDPAYIYCFHYRMYKDIYGNKTPEEAAVATCFTKIINDPSEFNKCYKEKDIYDSWIKENDWK